MREIHKPWTDSELTTLKTNFRLPREQLAALLSKRTLKSIYLKCNRLGLLRIKGAKDGGKQIGGRRKGYEEICGSYLARLRKNANRRNIGYHLEDKYIWEKFLMQARGCDLSGKPIGFVQNVEKDGALQTASLDRIDTNEDYFPHNVRWVHKVLQGMRHWSSMAPDLTDDELLEWCEAIVAHLRKKKMGLIPINGVIQCNNALVF